MPKPRADLDALAVPKDAGPSSPVAPRAGDAPRNYSHTLSCRMTTEGYRRLRRYVADQEMETGRRVTHQGVIETALAEFFARRGR